MAGTKKTHYDFLKEVKTETLRKYNEEIESSEVLKFLAQTFTKEIRGKAVGAFDTPLFEKNPNHRTFDWDTFNMIRGEIKGIKSVFGNIEALQKEFQMRKKDVADERDGTKQ